VRQCVVMMQQPILFVTKVQGEVFAHFHAVPVKHHSSMWNRQFGMPGRLIFLNNPIDVKQSYEHSFLFWSQ
jgi:hypothetical protein